MLSSFQRIMLPGIVFQSVIVAGGYGTGREIVEFFLGLGPIAGLLAMVVTAVMWSGVCALTFEFARRFNALEYRTFFRKLLGRYWVLFDGSYMLVLLIVLSIVAATGGSMIQQRLGLPYNVGVLGLVCYICGMLYRGHVSIERMLSFWTVMLYAVFGAVCVLTYWKYGSAIAHQFAMTPSPGMPWSSTVAGIRYAGYNLGLIPAILFTVRHLTSRKEAVVAGLLSGLLAILPGIFLFLSMLAAGPEIHTAEVPTILVLQNIDNVALSFAYQVVMVMTLIETGIGLLHAFNDRVCQQLVEKEIHPHRFLRVIIGCGILTISSLLAQVGLIDLISRGYGALTWLIIAVYVVPLCTIGVWRLVFWSAVTCHRSGSHRLVDGN